MLKRFWQIFLNRMTEFFKLYKKWCNFSKLGLLLDGTINRACKTTWAEVSNIIRAERSRFRNLTFSVSALSEYFTRTWYIQTVISSVSGLFSANIAISGNSIFKSRASVIHSSCITFQWLKWRLIIQLEYDKITRNDFENGIWVLLKSSVYQKKTRRKLGTIIHLDRRLPKSLRFALFLLIQLNQKIEFLISF